MWRREEVKKGFTCRCGLGCVYVFNPDSFAMPVQC